MFRMNKTSAAAREKWSRIIEEQRASGLTVARFCDERRIAASSFFPWRKRLAGAPTFVEARVGVPAPQVRGVLITAPQSSGGSGVTIELVGGRRVIVTRGFDRDVLLEVIGALESGGEAGTGGAA